MIIHKLELADRERYEKILRASTLVSSQYSFLALWAWRESEQTEICFDDEICWLKNRNGFLSPICSPEIDLNSLLKKLEKMFPRGTIFNDVPEQFASRFENVHELRDEWEYIYETRDLIELKGKNYHQKRTNVKVFEREWGEQCAYFPLLSDDFDELRKFQLAWLARQEPRATLDEENLAIMQILEHWEKFPLFGAMMKAGSKIIAYTIAEELSADTLDIRFEKAFSEYEGVYQALNRKFLQNQGSGYKWVNREEDMGEEGLRRAKLSYRPKRFEKKWRITL